MSQGVNFKLVDVDNFDDNKEFKPIDLGDLKFDYLNPADNTALAVTSIEDKTTGKENLLSIEKPNELVEDKVYNTLNESVFETIVKSFDLLLEKRFIECYDESKICFES
jgi:hypothetical protein